MIFIQYMIISHVKNNEGFFYHDHKALYDCINLLNKKIKKIIPINTSTINTQPRSRITNQPQSLLLLIFVQYFHIVRISEPKMEFCNSYFLVNPTKASVFDLLLLLFSPNLTSKRFIDSPPDTLKSFRRSFASRWVIAMAVLVQKILIFLRKPLAFIGFLVTYWPNLLTANGGFFNMILHLLTGEKSNYNILQLTILFFQLMIITKS